MKGNRTSFSGGETANVLSHLLTSTPETKWQCEDVSLGGSFADPGSQERQEGGPPQGKPPPRSCRNRPGRCYAGMGGDHGGGIYVRPLGCGTPPGPGPGGRPYFLPFKLLADEGGPCSYFLPFKLLADEGGPCSEAVDGRGSSDGISSEPLACAGRPCKHPLSSCNMHYGFHPHAAEISFNGPSNWAT